MNARDKKTLTKILSYIKKKYVTNIEILEEFNHNSLLIDAVAFNLLQIGEVSNKKLTDNFKRNHNSIPWKQICGLRNRIVHDYDRVHLTIVYTTINNDLSKLSEEIKQLLED